MKNFGTSQYADTSIRAGFLRIFWHTPVEFDKWKPSIQ